MVFLACDTALAVAVGVVIDGPTARQGTTLDLVKQEVASLLGDEFDVSFPQEKLRHGDWTPDGVRTALAETLRDPQVDVIITLGLLASSEVARIERLAKPVIAAVVPDAELQGFPFRNGVSGRRNFVYISSFKGIDEELSTFHRTVGFSHLTIIADETSMGAVPEFRTKSAQLARDLGFAIDIVAVKDSVDNILSVLPAETDAVYVTPLWRLPADGIERLAAGLVKRGLPSLSLLGRSEVEAGLLMTIGGLPSDDTRFARRIGLNLQRILLGEDAGEIEVGFRLGRRLVINMRTARAIGFLPRWAVLIDAEKINDEQPADARKLGLYDAMIESIKTNLLLQASEFDIRIAEDDVQTARSTLLPQLDVSATRSQIDSDRANPLVQAEKSLDAGVGGSQIIYSEQARASLAIARRLADAAGEGYQSTILDTLQGTATAYLSLLRAQALEAVRRSNLEVTRTNLELARVRESVGASGRADVLRWESQIARDRQDVLSAQATRFRALTELNRVMNRPQAEPVTTVRDGLDETLAVLNDPRFDSFIGNPVVWETFIDFSVAEAMSLSPELRQFESNVQAQQRDVLAARRAWYVPDIALSADAGNNIDRSGAGSDRTGLMLDDESWTIGVSASLPLFSGGALKSRLSRSRHTLSQLERQYAALSENIEARMRAALHQVGGSFPAIELSQDAARAAAANLDLVIDAYSKGAVSVTDLIDAQDAALSAKLAAAEAEYAFLIDYMEILRARGNFDLVLDPPSSQAWYESVEAYFSEHGVSPLRR